MAISKSDLHDLGDLRDSMRKQRRYYYVRLLDRVIMEASLEVPRQLREMGAGVRGDSCYVCGQPAMYCASKHHASAQQDEREAFESEAAAQGHQDLSRKPDGTYSNFYLQCAWLGWQQRAIMSREQSGGQ